MNRKALDRVLASGGLVVAIVLLVAGGLLTWGHNYVHTEVRTQLVAQKIYFPPKGSEALASEEIGPYLNQYAGQQLVNGTQAKAYADHFIAVHLREIGGGQTYSQLSNTYQTMTPAQQASAEGQKLNGQIQTMFRGETLRGLLLNAYAFDTVGNIAWIGALVAYVAGGVMLVLSGLGFWHSRRVRMAEPPQFPARETINQ